MFYVSNFALGHPTMHSRASTTHNNDQQYLQVNDSELQLVVPQKDLTVINMSSIMLTSNLKKYAFDQIFLHVRRWQLEQ